jgi:Tol biopolymer transport system component
MPDAKFDLDRRLRGVDDVRMPDLWPSARDRAADDTWTSSPEPPGRRRLVAAGVALALTAAATGALVWSFRNTEPAPVGGLEDGVIVTVGRGTDSIPGVDNTDLVAIDPRTGARWNLTNTPEAESDPVWTADGTRVAFLRETTTDGGTTFHAGIFAMRSDGSDLEQLRDCGGGCGITAMAWAGNHRLVTVGPGESPTGARLSVLGGGDARTTAVCDADGCASGLGYLAVSPDGNHAAYAGNPFTVPGPGGPQPESIWVVNLGTMAPSRITQGDRCRELATSCFADIHPAWSPDSTTLAILHVSSLIGLPGEPQPPDPQIQILAVTGRVERSLPVCAESAREQPCAQGPPLWAPDGSRILTLAGYHPRSLVSVEVGSGRSTTLAENDGGPCDFLGAEPKWSPDGGSLVFEGGSRGGNICTVPTTGGSARLLIRNFDSGLYTGFAWLPAGAVPVPTSAASAPVTQGSVPRGTLPVGTLVFVSQTGTTNGGTGSNLWVTTSADPDPRVLDIGSVRASNPSLSPDGTRIVFQGTRGTDTQLWSIGTDGTDLTRLTDVRSGATEPAWSPNGDVIAFVTLGGGDSGISLIAADGTGRRVVWNGDAQFPDWTPDGSALTFVALGSDGGETIEQLDLATGATRPLLDRGGDQMSPSWSPDGAAIAFWWDTDGGTGLYLADARGSNVHRVPVTDTADRDPIAWSPDGEWLAFQGGGRSGGQVEVVRLDGSDLHRIADVSDLVSGPGPSGPGSTIRNQTEDPSWGPSPR